MSIPEPPTKLEGHCSTIHDDTLYVLSPDGFQSLELKKNATWSEESTGVSVKGAACVKAGQNSGSAFYVIGGTTDKDDYTGLQRYSFSDQSWETLEPTGKDMEGRTNHSAVYLEDTQSILVYAGSNGPAASDMSSQTFTISTQQPFTIEAYVSDAAPANLPILSSWNSSHAIMAGGSPTNSDLYLFDESGGWQILDTGIPEALDSSARGVLITGSDGSKVLEIYKPNVSPNDVTQYIIVNADGEFAQSGRTVGSGSGSSNKKRKRDLSLGNWPDYNSTNAPTATREDSSLAQASDGTVVLSGGNSDSPLAMFNQEENSWIDAGSFFNAEEQKPLQSETPSPTSSATPSASETDSDEAGGGGGGSHDKTLRTLGITLGVLCGIAALFILILFYLRYRKQKKMKAEGYVEEKGGPNDKDRMDFQDRGASFMKEAGGTTNELPPPEKGWYNHNNLSHSSIAMFGGKSNKRDTGNYQPKLKELERSAPNDLPAPGKIWNNNNGSHSSIAMFAGKFGQRRNTGSHQPKLSTESTSRLVKETNGTYAGGEPMEMVDIGDKRQPEQGHLPRTEITPPEAAAGAGMLAAPDNDRVDRSSGWSKYFATSAPTGPKGTSHLPSVYGKSGPNESGYLSQYSSDQTQPSRIPSSILVPPLDVDFKKTADGSRISNVMTGSPSFNDSREDLARRGSFSAAEGQRGLIVTPSRHRSQSESVSSYNNRSTFGSTMTSDFFADSAAGGSAAPWTPTTGTFSSAPTPVDDGAASRPVTAARPPSSAYTASVYEPSAYHRSKTASFFPGPGATGARPSSKGRLTFRGHGGSRSSDFGAQGLPPPGFAGLHHGESQQTSGADRDSSATLFPAGVPSTYYAGREQREEGDGKPVNTDLGWLNLGPGGENRI